MGETQPGLLRNLFKRLMSFPSAVAIGMVRFYQVCVSPLKPPTCRYTPSCSAYAIESIRKYGMLRGLWRAFRRILRCHPWGGSGYDPP